MASPTKRPHPAAQPRIALFIGISEYEHHPHLPGAANDVQRGTEVLESLCFEVRSLVGRVPRADLVKGVDDFLEEVETLADEHREPCDLLVAVALSCHGVLPQSSDTFPSLIASDAREDSEGHAPSFHAESQLIERLNNVRVRNGRCLQVVMIFDCCRLNAKCTTFRGQSILNSLRHDFYFAFACDPGRRAEECGKGGKLMQHVLQLLPYAEPISQVLEKAVQHIVASGALQRPWTYNRPGTTVPTLGSRPGPMPEPSTGAAATGLRSTHLGDPSGHSVSVVIMGSTGHGKSTLGNALLGHSHFLVSDGVDSETSEAKHGDCTHNQQEYRIVDTIGFRDTSMQAQELANKFTEFADLTPFGVDAFLLVMDGRRINTQHMEVLNIFRSAAGGEAFEHAIVVFTSAGRDLLQAPDAKQYCLKSNNTHLQGIAQQVSGIVAVDLRGDAEAQEAAAKVRREILALRQQRGGQRYSNEALQLARRRRGEAEAVVVALDGVRRQLLERRLNDLDEGRARCEDVLREALSWLDEQDQEKVQQREAERQAERREATRRREAQEAAEAAAAAQRVAAEAQAAAEAEARAAAAEAAAATPEARRSRAREVFASRPMHLDASWRFHSLKDPSVWDGEARDEQTGVSARVKHLFSKGDAKQKAKEKLFEIMFANGLLG